MEEKELLTEMIADAIENKRFKELCEKLEDVNPVDIAEAMDGLDEKQVTVVFRLLKKKRRLMHLRIWSLTFRKH